jgi:hypothetical protein
MADVCSYSSEHPGQVCISALCVSCYCYCLPPKLSPNLLQEEAIMSTSREVLPTYFFCRIDPVEFQIGKLFREELGWVRQVWVVPAFTTITFVSKSISSL